MSINLCPICYPSDSIYVIHLSTLLGSEPHITTYNARMVFPYATKDTSKFLLKE